MYGTWSSSKVLLLLLLFRLRLVCILAVPNWSLAGGGETSKAAGAEAAAEGAWAAPASAPGDATT